MLQLNSERTDEFKKYIQSRVNHVLDERVIIDASISLQIDGDREKLTIQIEYVGEGD